jgi:hypothetical protein
MSHRSRVSATRSSPTSSRVALARPIGLRTDQPLGETAPRRHTSTPGTHSRTPNGSRSRRSRCELHDDSAVIRYKSEIELHGTRGHYWHTDLYEKRNGQWKIVWSQTTSAP